MSVSKAKALKIALLEKLYGKKPGSAGKVIGGLLGGTGGAIAGVHVGSHMGIKRGVQAARLRRMARNTKAKQKLVDAGVAPEKVRMWAKANTLPADITDAIAQELSHGVKGMAIGGGAGGLGGAGLGILAGHGVDKLRMAKHLKHRSKVNKRLALGAGVGGLAALLSGKKKKASAPLGPNAKKSMNSAYAVGANAVDREMSRVKGQPLTRVQKMRRALGPIHQLNAVSYGNRIKNPAQKKKALSYLNSAMTLKYTRGMGAGKMGLPKDGTRNMPSSMSTPKASKTLVNTHLRRLKKSAESLILP